MSAFFWKLGQRVVHDRHRNICISTILLVIAVVAGTREAVEALRDTSSVFIHMLTVALVAGLASAGLLGLHNRWVRQQQATGLRFLVWSSGARFVGLNLALAAGLLVTGVIQLLLFGSAWWALLATAAVAGSVAVLLLGIVPVLPLMSLVLCRQPTPRIGSMFANWPALVLLCERQRRARRADSASASPVLEEFRDALDAHAAGMDSRGIRLPASVPMPEEVTRRLTALSYPAGVSALVTAIMLFCLEPAAAERAGTSPERRMAHQAAPDNGQVDHATDVSLKRGEDHGDGAKDEQSTSPNIGKQQPECQQPGGQQSGGQQSTGQQSTGQQSGGKQPGGQQPGGQQPSGQRPGGQQPGGQQPGGQQSGSQQPGGQQPGSQQPGGQQSGGKQPGGQQQGGQQQGGQQPGGQQSTGQQSTGQQPGSQQPGGQQPSGQPLVGQRPVGQQLGGQQSTGAQPGSVAANSTVSNGSIGKQSLDTGPSVPKQPATTQQLPPGMGQVSVIRYSGGTQTGGDLVDVPEPSNPNAPSDSDNVRRSASGRPAVRSPRVRPIQVPLLRLNPATQSGQQKN